MRNKPAKTMKISERIIPENTLECRDYGHQWIHDTAEKKGSAWHQGMRCKRCKIVRSRTLSSQGEVLSGWNHSYAAAPGYVLSGGRLTDEEKREIRVRNLEKK